MIILIDNASHVMLIVPFALGPKTINVKNVKIVIIYRIQANVKAHVLIIISKAVI